MNSLKKELQIRWSDLDPNFHLRHSVYYDWGAYCRVEFLEQIGVTAKLMEEMKIGPILFREECVFRKEIRLGDKVFIDFKILSAKKNFSKFTIQHTITKSENVLCAILNVDIAWMDITKRKLTILPENAQELLMKFPRADDFNWID